MKFYDYLIEKGKEDGIEKNVVGAVILNDKNEILILSRKLDDFMGGIDELPSGNMEKGEDIYQALVREVKEETNLDLKEVVCFINSFDYISGSGKKARQYNFAIKTEKNGNIELTEHDAYKWETLQSARENSKITDEVKECLEIYNFNNKQKESDFECHFCATACIVNKEKNKILFIYHKKLNKWLFVGGHIELNENPEDAVMREVKEETNLDIELVGERYPRNEDFIRPFALQKNYVGDKHIHMDIFYVAIDKGTSKLKEKEDEVKGSRWFSKEEIMNEDFDTFPEKKKMALDVLKIFEEID